MEADTSNGAAISAPLVSAFEQLRTASRAEPNPSYEFRRDLLLRLLALIQDHGQAIEQAISADFGHRSVHETRLAELMPVEASLEHALRHLRSWMRPKRVSTSLIYWPGTNRLLRQPLGVAAIIAPWNYPLQLTLAPAVGALAAGNRVMLKPSELVPRFSNLLQRLIGERFSGEEIVVVTGGADVSRALCALPFDHLLFTGSTAVGKLVAEAAARNLTPVTLELGGKSPAIIHGSADIETAARRIAFGKILNAGQTCIAPDYVICTPQHASAFEGAYRQAVIQMIGNSPENPDYSCIVSVHHITRLQDLVSDAIAKGARIVYTVDNPDAWAGSGKFPPCLVFETTEEMRLRQEEIFGPILPVVTARSDSDAIAMVNAGDRPLALYWFGTDHNALDRVLHETVSGGVTVNDCLLHQVQENQPFGGVGASGMGAYHGEWGFRTFSKEKPVFHRPRMSGAGYMSPPYGRTFDRMLNVIRRLS